MSTPQPTDQAAFNLDAAKALQSKLEGLGLHIPKIRDDFNSKPVDGLEDWLGEGLGSKIPSAIAADVASQISFLRKLKFQYLEQNAKHQYIKTIVNDEAPMITADDNEALMISNQRKKEGLKAAKLKLAEKYQDVRRLAPLVEHDFNRAKELGNEAVALAQSIIDARLAITRLRQAHPQPRLTIPTAEEHLAAQITEMQELEDKLRDASDQVARVRESVKEGSKEMERLSVERAEIGWDVKARGYGADDRRAASLCEQYSAALALHRGLVSMLSSQSVAENELRLTYLLEPDGARSRTLEPRKVHVVLLFQPTARQLVEARVEGVDTGDISSIIGAYVEANDVPGVVGAVLARCRAISTI